VRADALGPRTWLLAATAGWAVSVWLLALLGMGGRIEPLPDDPGLSRNLPALRPAPAPRIGPLSQYAEAAARPLFSDDRRPQPFSLQPEGEEQAPAFEFVLTSVLRTPTLQMAIIKPADGGEPIRMKLGESPEEAQGWRVVELNARSAVFEGPEGERTLDLRTFDGAGGDAPTPMIRSTRSNPAAATQPATAQDADPAVPAAAAKPTSTANKPASAPPAPSPEAQMETIRKRIEARRAQLREQAQEQQQEKKP
jgi:general secretion pathway protein N